MSSDRTSILEIDAKPTVPISPSVHFASFARSLLLLLLLLPVAEADNGSEAGSWLSDRCCVAEEDKK